MTGTDELLKKYREHLSSLHETALEIRDYVKGIFEDIGFAKIEEIRARAKDPESFAEKAARLDAKTGATKYGHPLEEIQDQIGVRIVTFYKHDVETVISEVNKHFAHVEEKNHVPDDPAKFGYEAKHLICVIPNGIRGKTKPHIDFFELQICTLFQHAWAQANHDLMYKPIRNPTDLEERLLAWAASQAFGADRIFEDLWRRFNAKE